MSIGFSCENVPCGHKIFLWDCCRGVASQANSAEPKSSAKSPAESADRRRPLPSAPTTERHDDDRDSDLDTRLAALERASAPPSALARLLRRIPDAHARRGREVSPRYSPRLSVNDSGEHPSDLLEAKMADSTKAPAPAPSAAANKAPVPRIETLPRFDDMLYGFAATSQFSAWVLKEGNRGESGDASPEALPSFHSLRAVQHGLLLLDARVKSLLRLYFGVTKTRNSQKIGDVGVEAGAEPLSVWTSCLLARITEYVATVPRTRHTHFADLLTSVQRDVHEFCKANPHKEMSSNFESYLTKKVPLDWQHEGVW